MKGNSGGFSLIELLIVVLIIGIIAAIAIPNMISARMAANEGSAISSLRSLHGAQSVYLTSKGGGQYAGTESINGDTVGLSTLANLQLIDPVMGYGMKAGYSFVGGITLSSETSAAKFFFSANPINVSGVTRTGTRRFNTDTIGVIRYDFNDLTTPFDANTAVTAANLTN